MKTKNARRWQRILVAFICLGVFALLWPFLHTKAVGGFWQSMRFRLPDEPSWLDNYSDWQAPQSFLIRLSTDSPEVLQNLKSAGFPVTLEGKYILVGPYLHSFQSEVDIHKISQIAGSSVKIEDWDS